MRKTIIRWMALLLSMICVLAGCAPEQPVPTTESAGNTEYPQYEYLNYEPGLIDTVYETEGVVLADYIIDTANGADPTGVADSTTAIQSVLDTCAENGGGTVFLPRGRYLVSSQIRVPSFVYLVGDWNDPDAEDFNGEYGTIIVADVAPAEEETRNPILADRDDIYANFPALFRMGGSAGLIGVTIWYPEQDINNVTPYPFAIEIPSFAGDGGHINHMATTVKNVTFINCYKGIIGGATASVYSGGYAAAFEQVHLENIKGTFLYQGFQLYIASEAGVVKNLSISNDYWKNSTLCSVDGDKLDEYTMKYTTGMLLGDLEWLFFDDITIRDVCIGVRLYDGIRRFFTNTIYFIGQFYRLDVRNTQTALRVDNMMPNFGVTIAESYLEGSTYSINELDETTSVVKLVNTTLVGDTYGDSIVISGAEDAYATLKAEGKLATTDCPALPEAVGAVYDVCRDYGADNTAATDASAAIQQALDDARANGGGIVYLKAGCYWLDQPLTVYDNTLLKGAASASTHDQIGMSKGTALMGNYGYATEEFMAENMTALITLQGTNSGMQGIRIIYPDNKPAPRLTDKQYKLHSYTVRILGENAYIAQCSILGVPYGVEIVNTKGVVITELSGAYYKVGVHVVNCQDVYLDELLENAAVVCRIGYVSYPALTEYFIRSWPTDVNGMSYMYSEITRPNLTLFKVENSTNVSIVNTSAFGIRTFYEGINSEAKILACNSDNCSDYIWKVNGGMLYAVNMFKYNDRDTFYTENGGVVNCFNTLTLHFTSQYTLDTDVVNNQEFVSEHLTGTLLKTDDLPERYQK